MPLLLTILALVAFAANSVLCRLALADPTIDPWSFTTIRLAAGALVLAALTARRREPGRRGDWRRASWLLLYALPFSLAYVQLDTGTGALLLFGAVQLTMLGLGISAGERPRAIEWLAIAGAGGGIVYLVSPGLSAPDPLGASLMIVAGIGWGCYSLAGKGAGDPIAVTAAAFARAALVAIAISIAALSQAELTLNGALLAIASGAITSGIGYVIWYAALRHLTATRAALVQLAVPVIAAAGGVALLEETVTLRLGIASVLILGSIAVGVTARRRA